MATSQDTRTTFSPEEERVIRILVLRRDNPELRKLLRTRLARRCYEKRLVGRTLNRILERSQWWWDKKSSGLLYRRSEPPFYGMLITGDPDRYLAIRHVGPKSLLLFCTTLREMGLDLPTPEDHPLIEEAFRRRRALDEAIRLAGGLNER